MSKSTPEEILKLKKDRIDKISSDQTPIELDYPARFILHIIPLSGFRTNTSIDISDNYVWLRGQGFESDSKSNQDGFIWWHKEERYTQLFNKNGSIEYVEGHSDPQYSIPIKCLESLLIDKTNRCAPFLAELTIPTPYSLFFSLINIKGFSFVDSDSPTRNIHPYIGSKDPIFLSEIPIDDTNISTEIILKPLFDEIRQTFDFFKFQ